MTPLQETIQAACGRILELVQERKEISSWQLKLMLQLSGSMLYLCLGTLQSQGKIYLEPDGINYKVSLPGPQNPNPNPF